MLLLGKALAGTYGRKVEAAPPPPPRTFPLHACLRQLALKSHVKLVGDVKAQQQADLVLEFQQPLRAWLHLEFVRPPLILLQQVAAAVGRQSATAKVKY